MKTLANLKKDLEFNHGLSSLIEVLKNIAVAQYRSLENKIKSFEKLILAIEGNFFRSIDYAKVAHPFLTPQNKSQLIVVVTSDTGLLGGLNMQVVKIAIREFEKIPGQLIVVGERGKAYARESGIPFVAFSGLKDEDWHPKAMQLRDYVLGRFLKEGAGYLKVVYPRSISLTMQRVEMASFLPFALPAEQKPAAMKPAAEMILESKLEDIVEYLVQLWVGQKIYEIFGFSRLAEFAARYSHLEESLQKLKDMDNKLRLEYFRVRHEIIDRNMRDLFSARLLYARR